MQTNRAIRLPEVKQMTGLSRSAIYRLERDGDFPRHWCPTPKVSVWDVGEVATWIDRCKASRSTIVRAGVKTEARAAA